ncbi:MAG: hypothetical protein LBP70_00740 [Mycoplasmataceae bacterium]|jgi:hypothetical protein|nr:hypothetical protein [Mycoplasmataceae bacterium]
MSRNKQVSCKVLHKQKNILLKNLISVTALIKRTNINDINVIYDILIKDIKTIKQLQIN